MRFGLNQALKVWPENADARAAYDEWRTVMVRCELNAGHRAAAEALLAEFAATPPALRKQVEDARRAASDREEEIAELESIRHDVDLAVGAGLRSDLAIVAVAFWTAVPLIGGFLTGWGENPLSPQRYLGQTVILIAFVLATVFAMRRRGFKNRANRQIFDLVISFVVLIPPYRLVTVLAEVPSQTALSIEQAIYGLMFGGVATLSGQRGLPAVALCSAAALLGVAYPDWVYLWLATSNCLALSWLAWVWRRQGD